MKSDRNQEPIRPLTTDPVYYTMVAVFAILTTGLPAGLGQPRFLPIAQAIALTVFVAIPLSAGLWRRAALVMALWLVLALAAMSVMTVLLPTQIEKAIPGGFQMRSDTLAWAFGATDLPGALGADSTTRLVELAGVAIGSLVTAGLAGNWFLMRAVNVTGFSMGILWRTIGSPFGLLLAAPVWSLLRIAGLAGLVLLFSQPLLSGHWSPRYYWESQPKLVVGTLLLLALGLALGFVGPPFWQSMLSAFVE